MSHDSAFDSLIFDMDGTLWDAVDTYARVWNIVLHEQGITRRNVTRDDITSLMGLPLDVITERIIGHRDYDMAAFLHRLDQVEDALIPVEGGRLYPGVAETIPLLARRFKLFMVSNCGASGLVNFLKFTRLSPYFTDALTHGGTGCDKATNIGRLIADYGLRGAMYIGDTEGDEQQSHAAGVPVTWARYGFGTMRSPEFTIDSFAMLQDIV